VASWAGEWRHHHYDARGHCIMLTDTNGTIREQYDYDAFGMPYFYTATGGKLLAPQQWGNRFLFTGREWLKDFKVYDFRNRIYQPELGRFLQPDPKQFEAGDYNIYRYCHNDPVNNSDATGLGLVFDPVNLPTTVAVGAVFLIKYDIQKMNGNAPTDDKAVHREVSQRMTEMGDPVSALLVGFAQELVDFDRNTTPADIAANIEGIKAGVLSQLQSPLTSPVSKLFELFKSITASEPKGSELSETDPEKK
jgi:RHS repeat-associated protein